METSLSGVSAGVKQGEYRRGTGSAELDKNAFLRLLITQLRFQDPLNPKDNSAFLAQMAQFSSLEQMQNLNAGLDKFLGSQTDYQDKLLEKLDDLGSMAEDLRKLSQSDRLSSLGRELLLLGKSATFITAGGEEVTGVITSVHLDKTETRLVADGQVFALSQLASVHGTDSEQNER